MAGKQAQFFQIFVIVLDDLRHKFIKANKAAEILFEYFQAIFLLLTGFKTVFRIGD
ncbi:hypothetical protein HmCmsJML164_01901 [Escherichia coli]|nr:hypothetical protein HmCmsJML164_01901 [Escherichia coli]